MHFKEKITSLRKLIFDQLTPLINTDFVYLDLPYYDNIGDTMIWEGTLNFIKDQPYKCLYKSSLQTFKIENISATNKDIILLQGGGNFGDLWYAHQEFRLSIIQTYPDRRIIILPQTVHYECEQQMIADAEIMAKHPDLIICARDNNSLKLLKKHFSSNQLLLLPDMAFCIPPKNLNRYKGKEGNKSLFLKRNDKELSKNSLEHIDDHYDVRDWPSLEQSLPSSALLYKMISSKYVSRNMTDRYAHHIFKNKLIAIGTQFINQYKEIQTTRLHVAILAILLHKKFTFHDNSYGKNSTFYETWLKDLNGITFTEN